MEWGGSFGIVIRYGKRGKGYAVRVWKDSIKKEEFYVTKVNGTHRNIYRTIIDKEKLFYV